MSPPRRPSHAAIQGPARNACDACAPAAGLPRRRALHLHLQSGLGPGPCRPSHRPLHADCQIHGEAQRVHSVADIIHGRETSRVVGRRHDGTHQSRSALAPRRANHCHATLSTPDRTPTRHQDWTRDSDHGSVASKPAACGAEAPCLLMSAAPASSGVRRGGQKETTEQGAVPDLWACRRLCQATILSGKRAEAAYKERGQPTCALSRPPLDAAACRKHFVHGRAADSSKGHMRTSSWSPVCHVANTGPSSLPLNHGYRLMRPEEKTLGRLAGRSIPCLVSLGGSRSASHWRSIDPSLPCRPCKAAARSSALARSSAGRLISRLAGAIPPKLYARV